MELTELKKLVYSSYKVYLKRETHKYIGYCRVNKSGSMIVSINANLKGIAYDLVLKHELGHIYYRHFDDVDKDLDDIKKIYKTLTNSNAPRNTLWTIRNICQDIFIHDTILEKQQVEFLEQLLDVILCTSERYNAPSLLPYQDYYEYVIKKKFDKGNSPGGMPGSGSDSSNSDGDGQNSGDGDNETDSDPIEGDEPFETENETDSDTEKNGGVLQTPGDQSGNGSDDPDIPDIPDSIKKLIKQFGGSILGGRGKTGKIETEKEIQKFMDILKSYIYKLTDSTNLLIDSFRKTEKLGLKDGLFRKSIRLKQGKKLDKYPVVFFVDSSPSMEGVISAVVGTILECNNKGYVHKDSILILCSNGIDYEEKMADVKKDTMYIGNGTYLSNDLRKSLDKYKTKKFIVISDYEDQNVPKLAKVINDNRSRIVTIRTKSSTSYMDLSPFGKFDHEVDLM